MEGLSLTQVKKKVKTGAEVHFFKAASFILKFYGSKLQDFKWDYYKNTNVRGNTFIITKKTNIKDDVKKTVLSLLKGLKGLFVVV